MELYAVYNIITKIVFRYSYKNNFRVELLLFTKKCHAQNGEVACDAAYSMNFLNDSKLLDLGSPFNHYLSLGICALIKQYAKHFHA